MIPLENILRSDVTFFSFSPLPSISFNRLYNGKTVMPWIYSILVYHSRHLMSEESATQTLNSLIKVICDEVLLLLYDSEHFGLSLSDYVFLSHLYAKNRTSRKPFCHTAFSGPKPTFTPQMT